MKLNRALLLPAATVLAAGLLPIVLSAPANAAPPPIVVTGGDVSVDGSSGWAVESRNGGTGAFVDGTGTPPLGVGSYYLKSNAIGDKQFLHMTKVDGVALAGRPLTDLQGLSFSSYAANGVYSPYVNIPIHSGLIDANSDGIADGLQDPQTFPTATGNAILVYEPTVAGGAWNSSDTIAPSATWRLTRPVISGGTIPIWTYKTYSEWTTILTDGTFNSTYGDIQWVIGDTSSASWAGKEGWVDDIAVTTNTESATYDLEEGLGSCPVSIDRPAKTLTLTANCTTNTTLTMHDGWSLDGAGFTITAIDPPSGSFTGPVLTNEIVSGGATMNVTDVTIHGVLAPGCSGSLFGIRFNGAAGSFTHSTVSDIRYGAGSGCQSGNSVDITNLGGPTRLNVNVDDVSVTGFQKTGIRANGNVSLRLTGSTVASSDLDFITASNSLQISRGARAYVTGNTIGGNDWDGNDQWSATGVLLYGAEDVTFIRNVVTGTDTDFGLYVSQDATYQAGHTTLTCNLFERDAAPDPDAGGLDLWNTGVAADADLIAKVSATGNTVQGFATSYDNIDEETGGPCASGPVSGLQVNGGTSSVTASWTPPTALGFAPVTSYQVTLSPGGSTQTVTDPTATFTGLAPAKEYTATVTPVNAAGSGTPSSASGTTAPGAAAITSTSVSDTTAGVTWTVPGNAYTAFDVTISDGGGVVDSHTTDGDARTWTFTGLDPETDYTFSVTPLIGVASGTPDTADVTTLASTSITAPGPVSALTLVGAGTTLTANWTAAAGATDYEATLLPGGQVVSTSGTSAPFTIVPGKEYTVTVVAHNSAGWGPGRSASVDTKLPRSPKKLSVTGGVKSAALTWTAPTPPSPVTGYTVTATPTTGSPTTVAVPASGLTFPVTVSGLTPNMAYTFTVTATNAFGTGPAATTTLQGSKSSLNVNPTKVVAGHKVAFSGKVLDATTGKPVTGQTITLFRKTKGSSSYVNRGAQVKTSAKGKYSFSLKQSATSKYYVVSSAHGRMSAKSQVRSVTVKGHATLKASKTTVAVGKKVTFSGKAQPNSTSTVQLQRRQGSSWVTKKQTTPSNGGYSLVWKFTNSHDYAWRVTVSGSTFSTGVSNSQTINVR